MIVVALLAFAAGTAVLGGLADLIDEKVIEDDPRYDTVARYRDGSRKYWRRQK